MPLLARIFFLVLLPFQIEAADCSKALPGERSLGKGDFLRILTSRPEAEASYAATLAEPRRWKDRAFRDEKGVLRAPLRGEDLPLPEVFVRALGSHLEKALAAGYADYVFYPDFGHGHLLYPEEEYRALKELPFAEASARMLASPRLRLLYHTAELFKLREGRDLSGPLVKDPWLQKRYLVRNFTGDPEGKIQLHQVAWPAYNTVRKLPGYIEVRSFSFSASPRGCLPYLSAEGPGHFDFSWD